MVFKLPSFFGLGKHKKIFDDTGLLSSKKIPHIYCDDCAYLKKTKCPTEENYFNYLCILSKVPAYDRPRTIKFKSFKNEGIKSPEWCPLKNGENHNPVNETKKEEISEKKYPWQKSYIELENAWKKVKPLNTFKNIKVGSWYRIPPVNGLKRKTVLILSKSLYTVKYRELGKKFYATNYIYDSDLEVGFMVELPDFKENG